MTSFFQYVVNPDFEDSASPLTGQAVRSFLRSMRRHGHEEVSNEALGIWIVDMTLEDYRLSTRKRYFSRLAAIYQEWRQSPGDNPFADMEEAAGYDYESGFREASANLAVVDRLVAKDRRCEDREVIDVFLFLLYNVGASVDDVISLKFGDPIPDNPQTYDLVDAIREEAGIRRYVFGLDRGNKRVTQIRRELIGALHAMLARNGMRFADGFSRDSVTAMWMASAIRSGLPFAEIRSMVARIPAGYDSFRLIKPGETTERQRAKALNRVANSINSNATMWFVMKMRFGQTPDSIRRTLAEDMKETYGGMLFYYPTRKVKRISRGKTVTKEIPYLPSILFFKVRREKVPAIAHRIGDMAWCYKVSNTPGSPYCTISHEVMKNFQRHIGQFSADIRMELVSRDNPLKVGSEVMISGGGRMEGHIGQIQSLRNADGTRTYTLTLSEGEYAKWTVNDIDEVFIKPL